MPGMSGHNFIPAQSHGSPAHSHASFENPECADRFRKAIVVLGMHRSGTSALTRVLGLCGGALPAGAGSDAHESNPLGHWEPPEIVEAHERFLADSGLRWDDSCAYPPAIFESGVAETYRDRLTEISARAYGRADMFVVKDPRLSRLMPLWRPVLSRLGSTPRAVIVVRNPLDVAASLRRRDDWDEYRAVVVWMRYLLTAERDTRDMPRCFVRHDQLVREWRTVVRSIADALAIPLKTDDATTSREIDAFIRTDLVHHRRPDADLFERGDIPDCVKQVYRQCGAAATGEAVDVDALDAIYEALGEVEGSVRGTGVIGRGLDWQTIDLGRRQSRRDALLALSLAELGKARDEARKSQRTLDFVLSTRSWRLTRPFRAVFYLVKPPIQSVIKRFSKLSRPA